MSDPKTTAPRSESEVPARTPEGEAALPTMPDAPTRVAAPKVGQVSGTGYVAMHKDDNDTKVETATIAADVEDKRIKGRLEEKRIEAAARLELVKTIALWSGIVIGTLALVVINGFALYYGHTEVAVADGALLVVGLAVFLGRALTLKVPGVDASTGAAVPPPAGGDNSG